MQVISEGREICCKFWGRPHIQEIPYRLMRYLIRTESPEGMLLLNTVTGELVLLSAEERDFLEHLPSFPSPEIQELIEHHFLVPETNDDLKSVDQLRRIIQKFDTSDIITGYTILPTSSCNARCFYCYESKVPHCTMTSETADKVIHYIDTHCGKDRKVSLHWFGGEPTMGEKRIDQICDGLTERSITYASTMISNGYLFSRKMAQKSKTKWHLKSIQITLDGTEEIYNKTKAYVCVQDNPFHRVLDNIAFLLEQDIRVTVRMNLGLHNAKDLESLIEILAARFAGNDHFSAYVHELFENQGFDTVVHSPEERLKLAEVKDSLNSCIREKGCKYSENRQKELPSLKTFYCMADTPSSLIINPAGEFGKCEHVFFHQKMGDLDHGHDFSTPDAQYWLHPAYAETCKGCELYPWCGQPETCETKEVCFPEKIREIKTASVKQKIIRTYNNFRREKP